MNPTTKKLYHASVNACLSPLVSVDGKHVITVEGIGNVKSPHAVQQRIAVGNGSQCGFCTPGIVMVCCYLSFHVTSLVAHVFIPRVCMPSCATTPNPQSIPWKKLLMETFAVAPGTDRYWTLPKASKQQADAGKRLQMVEVAAVWRSKVVPADVAMAPL